MQHEPIRRTVAARIDPPRPTSRAKRGNANVSLVKVHAARDRLEAALAHIVDPKGEGARACLTVYARYCRLTDLSAARRTLAR